MINFDFIQGGHIAARRKSYKIKSAILVYFLFAAVGAGIWYAFTRVNAPEPLLASLPQALPADNQNLLAELGRLITLPKNEIPTIATVTDPEKLKEREFFAHAQAGYKVIIYAKSKKAILYDPVEHKIIDVAPLNFEFPK